jgi:hypothetical protein
MPIVRLNTRIYRAASFVSFDSSRIRLAWLARMQGEYYSRGKVTLEPLKRIGADREADWQAALAAFLAARCRATH